MREQLPNQVAQALFSRILGPRKRSTANRLLEFPARRVRRFWAAHGDPLITHRIGGHDLLMPLSSDLPIILTKWPHYATNLVRLATIKTADHENTAIVDIGSNVGDSVALLRTALSSPILCVEGDELFVGLLRRNMRYVADVEIEEAFVKTSSDDVERVQSVSRQAGTAALVPSASGLPLARPVRSLSEILDSHARFSSPGFIKIDTDGADSQIIINNQDIFTRSRPVVFFEFDPILAARIGCENPYRAIEALAEVGYDGALVYAHTGELMLASRAIEMPLWRDLERYILTHGPGQYYDIALFHSDDHELFERVTATEREYFNDMARRHRW